MKRIQRIFSFTVFLSLGLCLIITSCYKEKFTTDQNDALTFSTDTLNFDTVLTSVSTVSRFFRVYNPHGLSIRIDEVKLAGPNASFFNLNIDGISGDLVTDVIILPHDSIYVFAEATIDPDQPESLSPFILEADIVFVTNGNTQNVKLIAWGQNANYIPGPNAPNRISLLTCEMGEIVWDDPKPYVLYGTLLIDSCTLVLPAGARLFVHGGIANNQLGIYNEGLIYTFPSGKIKVMGTANDPVIIRDDRIEPDFEGEWAGIRLGPESGPHQFSFMNLSNGIVGISADSASEVSIDHSNISFTSGPGFFARHAKADISNSLFFENGSQSVALTFGGDYSVTYCTMSNFGNTTEALLLNNFYCSDPLCSGGALLNLLNANVRNSIMVGSSTDELWMVDAADPAELLFNVTMKNNIVVVDELLDPDNFPSFFETICPGCKEWSLSDTLFVDIGKNDYHLDTMSIAEMKAIPVAGLIDDLEAQLRDAVAPDIGCYEFQ
ncbi:MAG TPA: hypothetical protein VFG10_01795 [Saprospiraceae bacterium]|nr:hypothetical protein [Saprospiraceae bacterium]